MGKLLSIITVVFNDNSGLEKTIQSVINQSFISIEYIVVDGGSTDETISVIKKHESNICRWVSEPDGGIYDAMNKGIRMASGEWLNFMNAGDVFASNTTIEEMVPYLKDVSILHGNMIRKDHKHQFLSRGAHGDNLDAFDFMHASLCHQATFIHRSLFQKYGGYSTMYKLASDAEFFFRMIIQNKESYKYIDKTVAVFELGGASTTRKELYDEERKSFLIDALGESTYNRFEELYLIKQCKTALKLAALKQFLKRLKHKFV